MSQFHLMAAAALPLFVCAAWAQDPASKPDQHVLGTITATDWASHIVTVKDDKTGTEYSVSLEKTKTLLKVQPSAKDLKSATRIAATDLAAGDRVDIRGFKTDSPSSIAAASVILMSGRDLQKAHEAEMAEWRRRGTAGIVTLVDSTAHILKMRIRTPDGPQSITVNVPAGAQFTRYSPEHPGAPVQSSLTDIQPGDEVRVLGDKAQDGFTITAEKIYSGSFRTIAGTVNAVSPEGKQLIVMDLQSKQPVEVELTPDSAIRRIPPPMAAMLARRLNPNFREQGDNAGRSDSAPGNSDNPASRIRPGEQAGGDRRGGRPDSARFLNGPAEGSANPVRGDISQMLERLPRINVSDLKSGDAVVVSGGMSADKSRLIATNIIAGVEPVLQSAPSRQGRSLGDDWNLDMAMPAQ